MRKVLVLPVMALILASGLLAACGSNSVKNVQATTTTSFVNKADDAIAQKLVITQADLPTGWTTSTAGADATGGAASGNNIAAGLFNQLSSCLGLTSATAQRTDLYSGLTFQMNSNAVSSGVSAFKTADPVTTEVAGINNSANYSCIQNLFQTFIGQVIGGGSGSTPSSTVSKIDGLNLTAKQFGLRVTTSLNTGAPTTVAAFRQTVTTDVIGAGNGRFVSTVAINYFSGTPAIDFETSLLQKLDTKLASAPQS